MSEVNNISIYEGIEIYISVIKVADAYKLHYSNNPIHQIIDDKKK